MRAAILLALVALVLAPCSAHSAGQKSHKRALLAANTELATGATVDGGSRLLCSAGNCVRPLSKTQSDKTPLPPKITRKSFNQGAKKALLAAETELALETLADSSRKLLCFAGSCVRPLSKTQTHKMTRKSFNQGPKKALLVTETGLATGTTVDGGRRLLCFAGSCVRPLSRTQTHKTPSEPKMSRKSFSQTFPGEGLPKRA